MGLEKVTQYVTCFRLHGQGDCDGVQGCASCVDDVVSTDKVGTLHIETLVGCVIIVPRRRWSIRPKSLAFLTNIAAVDTVVEPPLLLVVVVFTFVD